MSPQEDLKREILEETGLDVTWVADNPCYFLTDKRDTDGTWIVNVLYETSLANLDFTPSDECSELRYLNLEECKELDVYPNTLQFAAMFDPENHK